VFPYLDLEGYRFRTIIPPDFVDEIDTVSPGWIAQNLLSWSSWVNGRLRKRYGAASQGNALPFGQQPPIALGAGTLPPSLVLLGRPTIGSLLLQFQVTTAGALGAALFQWSRDGGRTNVATNVPTAALVPLPGTGLTVQFLPTSVFAVDNVYVCDTPVPEIVLRWLVAFTDLDVMKRRYRQTNDAALEDFKAAAAAAAGDVKEAADSKDGLFDLPVNEASDSAVTTAFPLGYSETSPYVWTTEQARTGITQDNQGSGS
jgi:hypothetical protein